MKELAVFSFNYTRSQVRLGISTFLLFFQKDQFSLISSLKNWRYQSRVNRDELRSNFDADYYIAQISGALSQKQDPLKHFLSTGWRLGLDPNDWFSTLGYMQSNPDVAQQSINPFIHYLQFGREERRTIVSPSQLRAADAMLVRNSVARQYLNGLPDSNHPLDRVRHFLRLGRTKQIDLNNTLSTDSFPNDIGKHTSTERFIDRTQGNAWVRAVFDERQKTTNKGPDFELFDPEISNNRDPKAKALAYYLPQFHPTPENDAFWGTGFTEWRNVARGQPRFVNHLQPSVPRDFGYYSLDDPSIMRKQIEMAKAAGLHGFCYYYYWFDGQRVLDKPIERLLADPSLDFPFVLLWANENWTRTWDGMESHVLLSQEYDPEKDADLVADLARHFVDPRYIRIGDRPLWFIYRPNLIPDPLNTIQRWRDLFAKNHGLEPLMMMAQGFGNTDPREFGLDGAIEFPPHKLCEGLQAINHTVDMLDAQYTGHIMDYDQVVARADAEPPQDYPLIRTITPHWDNESRRPGAGMTLHGSTPQKFEAWARRSIAYAQANPVLGETIIAVNAWNEWAEKAYLEPDVYYGSAYLNALSRALHRPPSANDGQKHKLVIVGHDAHPHGAQMLVANMATTMTQKFGIDVVIVLCDAGPMIPDYEAICETHVLDSDEDTTIALINNLVERGFRTAIANTTVSGNVVPLLKKAGLHTTSLIHELAQLLRDYKLEEPAQNIAKHADRVVFPATPVRDSFIDFAGDIANATEIRPQGLYKTSVLDQPRGDNGIRGENGIPANAQIVINAGYADMRKGIDRFIEVAQLLCAQEDTTYFVWLGRMSDEVDSDLLKITQEGPLAHRFIFPGLVDDVERWLGASDLFFLSAREDPFPSVVLEALAAGLPVIGYAGTGGCDDLIAQFGTLVSTPETSATVTAIKAFLDQPVKDRTRAAEARRSEVERHYVFDDYCFELATTGKVPHVSVIVPNYNYANCIEERLLSIFAQSQPISEIIVLDDASTDNSVEMINSVAQEQNREIELIVNATNTGSPFAQWRSGLEKARGEYIWIAEADDVADPGLLKQLIDTMIKEGADFGFCDSWQIDETGKKIGESYKSYVNAVEPGLFDKTFAADGPTFLSNVLAIKNVILNVSGVVFRKDALAAAMTRCEQELNDYNLVGDWRLYADICAHGGRVAYVAQPLNGHRRHATSVTHALEANRHLEEIQEIQAYAATQSELPLETVQAQQVHLEECRAHLQVKP